MSKINIKGMDLPELEGLLQSWGEPSYRARQLAGWVYGRRPVRSFSEMSNLPLRLRERLEREATLDCVKEEGRQVSEIDGTTKFLFRLGDGNLIESVLLDYDFGKSVCVSSQVGCAMGCGFCASTLEGVVRNLTAGEMIDQLLQIQYTLPEGADPIRGIVVMGSGEPLLNLDAVIRFLALAHEDYGLGMSYRHMTVSTSGVVPGIRKLAALKLPITLAVSLHAPTDSLRAALMPVAARYPLAELMRACDEYAKATGRRITFEYILIKDVNDGLDQADELARLVKGILCHVNLIPLNPVPEREFARSDPDVSQRFADRLMRLGVAVTIRRELGGDIDAACGQLRRRAIRQESTRAGFEARSRVRPSADVGKDDVVGEDS